MKILVLFLTAAVAFGQISLERNVKDVLQPNHGGRGTVPANTLPATCTPGQTFFKLNATPGLNYYGCSSTNTWTLQSGSGGGGGSGIPPYSTATITTSPMSIPNSTHGQGVHAIGTCWSSAALGQEEMFGQEAMGCLWSRDPATGDLTLTYTTAPARVDIAGGSGVTAGGLWGTIIGNVADQVDLNLTFAPKASPIFTGQPTIPDFTLSTHTHLNAAGGGTLTAAAIAAGVLTGGVGGTGNGFLQFAGPAISLKTWTIPNASIDWTAISGVVKMVAGVPSAVTGTSTNCVLVDGTSGTCGSGSGGGSVFPGSTAVSPTSSGTMTFSLADVSAKSPVRFEPTVLAANVNPATFTNKTAGAKFSIAWIQAASGGPYTVTYGSANNTCPINATASVITTQQFEVAADGTTVNGVGCSDTDTTPGIAIPGATSGAMRIIAPATAGGVVTGPTGTTTLMGKNTTDIMTGKTFDTAGAGNVLKINGTTLTDVTGTGRVCLETGSVCTGSGGAGTPAVTYTFTSQTTVTINATTTSVNVTPTTAHGLGTLAIPKCFDSATPRVAMLCDYTRDTSGNLVFTFSPAQSGQIQVGSDSGGGGTSSTTQSYSWLYAGCDDAGNGVQAQWSLPNVNRAVIDCNSTGGGLAIFPKASYSNTVDQSLMKIFRWPTNVNIAGTVSLNLTGYQVSGGSGNVRFTAAIGCQPAGTDLTAAVTYNAASNTGSVAVGASFLSQSMSISGISITGAAANRVCVLKLTRDNTVASNYAFPYLLAMEAQLNFSIQ